MKEIKGKPTSPRLALEEMLLVSVYWVELGDTARSTAGVPE